MSKAAYKQFLALPVGTIFTSTANWGETDAFIKCDEARYRRTYDYIKWRADWDILADYTERQRSTGSKDNWPGIRTMEKVPEWISHNPPLTEEECDRRLRKDQKRVRDYIEKTGEFPEMGFW